jgi:hypothetical protein
MAGEGAKHTSFPVDISIATRPSNIHEVPNILKDIEIGINGLATSDDEYRKDVLVKCRALVQALETPRETMVDHCWGQVNTEAHLLNIIN